MMKKTRREEELCGRSCIKCQSYVRYSYTICALVLFDDDEFNLFLSRMEVGFVSVSSIISFINVLAHVSALN